MRVRMSNYSAWAKAGIEPDVEELLSDPLAEIVLSYNGLTPDDVRVVVRAYRARMHGGIVAHDSRRRSAA